MKVFLRELRCLLLHTRVPKKLDSQGRRCRCGVLW